MSSVECVAIPVTGDTVRALRQDMIMHGIQESYIEENKLFFIREEVWYVVLPFDIWLTCLLEGVIFCGHPEHNSAKIQAALAFAKAEKASLN